LVVIVPVHDAIVPTTNADIDESQHVVPILWDIAMVVVVVVVVHFERIVRTPAAV
jgi:hypothetical protein